MIVSRSIYVSANGIISFFFLWLSEIPFQSRLSRTNSSTNCLRLRSLQTDFEMGSFMLKVCKEGRNDGRNGWREKLGKLTLGVNWDGIPVTGGILLV